MTVRSTLRKALIFIAVCAPSGFDPLGRAQEGKELNRLQYPPTLPDGESVVTHTSREFLRAPAGIKLQPGVTIARTPPTVNFLYYPMQRAKDYWSNWGDGLAVEGKYYSSYGNHKGIGGQSFVCEYDVKTRKLRLLVDVTKYLSRPKGYYTPGKIHGRLDLGRDGWLYFVTARGSTRVTNARNHFRGEWLLRVHPVTGKIETVAYPPLSMDSVMDSLLDPERMIFYGGTVAGDYRDKRNRFFAYDVKNRKLLHAVYDGPRRLFILAPASGRVYYVGSKSRALYRYDPASGAPPVKIKEPGAIGIRAVTRETPQGYVYTISSGQGRGRIPALYRFHTRTEKIEKRLDDVSVADCTYVTTVDADPTGRYLYYVPGAHGGSERDGAAVVQLDTRTLKRKVIAFLHPFHNKKYRFTPMGTYGVAVSPKGDTLYITWSGNRGGIDPKRGKLMFMSDVN